MLNVRGFLWFPFTVSTKLPLPLWVEHTGASGMNGLVSDIDSERESKRLKLLCHSVFQESVSPDQSQCWNVASLWASWSIIGVYLSHPSPLSVETLRLPRQHDADSIFFSFLSFCVVILLRFTGLDKSSINLNLTVHQMKQKMWCLQQLTAQQIRCLQQLVVPGSLLSKY